MMIRSVDVLSVAKIHGLLLGIFGLIPGGMFTLMSVLGIAAGGGQGGAVQTILFGVGAFILIPLFYGIVGFVMGAIGALIYNLLAGSIGGIVIHFDQLPFESDE
ncbi:MAG: hypothetical protein ACK5Q5_02065 [Planctomycetaceae bacterium]